MWGQRPGPLWYNGNMETENYFNLGKIVNTHGIKGEVKVQADTDFAAERFQPGQVLWVKQGGNYQPLTVKTSRPHKGMWLLSFEGYPDINAVEALKGDQLYVDGDSRAELDDGEYYYNEIIDCQVYDQAGQLIGTVKEIMPTGANDVWVVDRPGQKDALIPVIDQVVKVVDPDQHRIEIEPMGGLFD